MRVPVHSLRWRLLLATFVWVVVSVLVVGAVVLYVFKEQAESQLRNELTVHMNQLSAALEWQGPDSATGGVQLGGRLSDPRFEQPLSGWYWQVSWEDEQGEEFVLQSESLWDESLPLLPMQTAQQWWTAVQAIDDEPLYLLQQRLQLADEQAPGLVLSLAAHETVVQAPMARFTTLLVVAFGLMTVGILLAAAFQFHAVMSPLQRLVRQLRAIERGESKQLQGQFPSEVQPLAEAFNRVLSTNAVVLERARAQAGNLAHTMKTPMTVLANAAAEDETELGVLVREQVGQAQQQLSIHLARARAIAQVKTFGVRTRVPPVVESVQRVCERIYADKALQWQLQLHAEDFYFSGELHDLQEIVGNILDNACKWANRRIHVYSQPLPGNNGRLRWELICEDDGPGIAAKQRQQIFKRGVRQDESAPGSGLGLAIVNDLVTVYEGRLQAGRSSLGGLRISLQLG